MAGKEGEWRDTWEIYADREERSFRDQPVAHLLEMIAARRFGDYHTIWRVLADRVTLEQAGWVLFPVLESDVDYLHRYHCAETLLALLGEDSLQPVQLSADWSRAEHVPRLKRLLEQRLGPARPTD